MGRAFQNRKDSMAKTAAAKTKVYGKYGREIYVSAKSGGVDPDGNLALRGLLERARKDQVPAHVIEKALEKSQGVGGADYSLARYEGFGPNGTMLIVDCLSDNPNRTFGDVRQCFTKTKTKIGTPGNCVHSFDHLAIFSFAGENEEAVLDALVMGDVDVTDIESEDGMITVFAPDSEYAKTKQAIAEAVDGVEFEVDEIQFIPQNPVQISGEDIAVFEELVELLDDLDDVQRVYHNAEW
jgi:YebC/PmpR family DNA-binding regulatory protein